MMQSPFDVNQFAGPSAAAVPSDVAQLLQAWQSVGADPTLMGFTAGQPGSGGAGAGENPGRSNGARAGREAAGAKLDSRARQREQERALEARVAQLRGQVGQLEKEQVSLELRERVLQAIATQQEHLQSIVAFDRLTIQQRMDSGGSSSGVSESGPSGSHGSNSSAVLSSAPSGWLREAVDHGFTVHPDCYQHCRNETERALLDGMGAFVSAAGHLLVRANPNHPSTSLQLAEWAKQSLITLQGGRHIDMGSPIMALNLETGRVEAQPEEMAARMVAACQLRPSQRTFWSDCYAAYHAAVAGLLAERRRVKARLAALLGEQPAGAGGGGGAAAAPGQPGLAGVKSEAGDLLDAIMAAEQRQAGVAGGGLAVVGGAPGGDRLPCGSSLSGGMPADSGATDDLMEGEEGGGRLASVSSGAQWLGDVMQTDEYASLLTDLEANVRREGTLSTIVLWAALRQVDHVQLARGVVASWPHYPSGLTALRHVWLNSGGQKGGAAGQAGGPKQGGAEGTPGSTKVTGGG